LTISWTLTRERICDKALEKCQRLGVGRTVSGDDRALCLEALDSILKNLHWHGYSWPKTLSSSTTLSFTTGLTSQALPQDFYTGAMLNYVDASGNEVPVPPTTPEEWKSIVLKSTRAAYPTQFYIDNFNTLWLYPVPSAALSLKLYYQKVISDSVASSSVDLDSPWLLGLAYGVAAEVGDEFGVDPKKIARFEAKWAIQRDLGIRNEAPPGPDRMQVSD
jgi:hypothetical protein